MSHTSSENSQQRPCRCALIASSDSPTLYRPTTKESSISIGSSNSTLSDVGSQPSMMRYGGRGGAGSRFRVIPQPPPQGSSIPQSHSQPSNFKTKWRPVSSVDFVDDVPPPVPTIPASSLAGRRGAANILSPLVLCASSPQIVPSLNTPPLSATTPSSSATESEFPNTPRTPYFYFDEAFEAPRAQSPLPSPNTSGSMSRSLRRLASRTQEFFLKDRSLKAPPPSPALPSPISSTYEGSTISSGSTRSMSLSSPSETSLTSEWYDAPESYDNPIEPSIAITPEPSISHPSPPVPIVIDLPRPGGGRARSASSVTVKARHKHTGERERKQREPRTRGDWNNDMGEVIVALRMLK
ncbi:hypothetical protein K438DRAFT_1988140 [Mycena galopus ATCC 62051]|nr:hypothetical protein K438DRAFT_1988140 [Mycena galopus ATCC 62051]